jgi:hypothetical protein
MGLIMNRWLLWSNEPEPRCAEESEGIYRDRGRGTVKETGGKEAGWEEEEGRKCKTLTTDTGCKNSSKR